MIGGEDDDRIPPQIEPIQRVEEASQPAIQEDDLRCVASAIRVELLLAQPLAPGDVGRGRGHAGDIVAPRIEQLEDVFRRVPRLVRVENVQVQIKVGMPPVALKPVDGALEDLGTEVVLLPLPDKVYVAPVPLVLAQSVAFRAVERHGIGAVGVRLAAAHEVEAGVTHVVVTRALLPQVEVVGEQGADPVAVLDRPLHGLVGRAGDLARQVEIVLLQRPPAALQEFVAAGVDVAARGHARRRAGPAVVEGRAAGGQAIHGRRRHGPRRRLRAPALVERPAARVRAHVVAAQGVAEDDDGIHDSTVVTPGAARTDRPCR